MKRSDSELPLHYRSEDSRRLLACDPLGYYDRPVALAGGPTREGHQ